VTVPPTLLPDERTLHGWFDRDLAPVLAVDPGTTVRFGTLDSGWWAGPHGPDRRRVPEHAAGSGHALTGPVEVRGARPGDVLAVRVDAVVPGPWGTTYAGARATAWNVRLGVEQPAVVPWEIDVVAGTATSSLGTVALRPFLGVMGMPPAEPGRHSTIPPYWHGGNLDCRELVAGATLYLPVPVAGALFSVGDGHAAQGDGEVSGTAIECPMERVDLTLSTVDDFPVAGPVARTPAGWVTMGLGDTVDEAVFGALNAMFDLLDRLFGVSRPDAVALASVAVDVRVTQIVNQVVGAHAVLPPGALR